MEDFIRFIAVAEHRSISHAAQALNISQPALSRSIRLLEERYNATLFTRGPQGVELTDPGRTLLLYANRAVRAMESAREEIDYSLRSKRLTLRLCSGDSWGYGVLPAVIRRFAREMPDIRIHLDLLEHDARLAGLDLRNYDVAFGVISPEGLTSGRYCFEPVIHARYDIYCDENHPLLSRETVTAQDLLAFPWLNHKFEFDYDPSSALRTERTFTHRSNAMLHAIETMRNSPLLLSTAKTMAPIFRRFGILPLMEDPESPVFHSGIILSDTSDVSKLSRKFIALVRSHCKENAF